jgi:hypothetical protein
LLAFAQLNSRGYLASAPVLPDGIFSNQKFQFGQNLEGLAGENFGIFYGRVVYFTVKWYDLWPFGTFVWSLGIYIFPVLVCCAEKNLATLCCTCRLGRNLIEVVRNSVCLYFLGPTLCVIKRHTYQGHSGTLINLLHTYLRYSYRDFISVPFLRFSQMFHFLK